MVQRSKSVLETAPPLNMAVDVPSPVETIVAKRAALDSSGSDEDEPAVKFKRR